MHNCIADLVVDYIERMTRMSKKEWRQTNSCLYRRTM